MLLILIMYKLKIAIVGAGNIAFKHLEVLEKTRNVSLVGITSRTRKKALYLARKFIFYFSKALT